ncbi:MAG TPA: cache domain-containing protein [Burkholderiales bacterium]|nr:cache domain-containing protein [Burkholderiales bacterium]
MSVAPRSRYAALRRPMLFVITASLVPAILLAIALIGWDHYAREREREVRDSLATARAVAAAVDAELSGIESALFALASSPYLEKDDFAAFHRQASAALKDQEFANIALLDETLRQRLNTFRPFGTPLPAEGNPQELRSVFSTGKPVVTGLFVGPVVKRPLIAVGVPLRRDGKVRYVLGAAVTPERLAHILRAQKIPPGWVAAIFDATGTIVARTHEPERFVGMKGAAELVREMQASREGVVQARTLEGIPVVSVFSRSPASGWSVAIGIPLDYFTRQLVSSLARLFIVMFLMLLVALGLAFLIARRLTG